MTTCAIICAPKWKSAASRSSPRGSSRASRRSITGFASSFPITRTSSPTRSCSRPAGARTSKAWVSKPPASKLDENGAIEVNEFSQTNVPHIYAVGDVTDRIALTPVAIREGHAFADSVFGGKPTPVDHANVPTAVFSEPECGVIGLTEAQACEKLAKVDIYKTTFRPMKATLSGRDTRTFMKLVVDGHDRPRGRRAYRRAGRRRDDPADRHRGQDERRPRPTSTPPWRCIRPQPKNS